MKYSFESLKYEYKTAHNGNAPLYCSRVATLSADFAFNFLDFVKVPVASNIGEHTHESNNQEVYIIISGNGEMTVNNKLYKVKAGDVIVNPIGGTHMLINSGSEEIRLIVIETPR